MTILLVIITFELIWVGVFETSFYPKVKPNISIVIQAVCDQLSSSLASCFNSCIPRSATCLLVNLNYRLQL